MGDLRRGGEAYVEAPGLLLQDFLPVLRQGKTASGLPQEPCGTGPRERSSDLRIGIAYEQGDYGTDTANTFADYAKANGLKIVTMLSIDPAALDFFIRHHEVEGGKAGFPLRSNASRGPRGLLIEQAKELGLSVPGGICGSGTVDGLHKLIKGKDVDYILDVVAPWNINADFLDPKQQKNLEEFRKRYKESSAKTRPISVI